MEETYYKVTILLKIKLFSSKYKLKKIKTNKEYIKIIKIIK